MISFNPPSNPVNDKPLWIRKLRLGEPGLFVQCHTAKWWPFIQFDSWASSFPVPWPPLTILKAISHITDPPLGAVELPLVLPSHRNGVHCKFKEPEDPDCQGRWVSKYKAFSASLGGSWIHFLSIQSCSQQPHNEYVRSSREGAKGCGELKQLSSGSMLNSADNIFSQENEMASNQGHFFLFPFECFWNQGVSYKWYPFIITWQHFL